jgi:preprotein translocase subunit SecA
MNARVDREVAEILFKLVLPEPEQLRPIAPPPRPVPQPVAAAPHARLGSPSAAQRPGLPGGSAAPQLAPASVTRVAPNEPCPCGSGKKYKKCHGV